MNETSENDVEYEVYAKVTATSNRSPLPPSIQIFENYTWFEVETTQTATYLDPEVLGPAIWMVGAQSETFLRHIRGKYAAQKRWAKVRTSAKLKAGLNRAQIRAAMRVYAPGGAGAKMVLRRLQDRSLEGR